MRAQRKPSRSADRSGEAGRVNLWDAPPEERKSLSIAALTQLVAFEISNLAVRGSNPLSRLLGMAERLSFGYPRVDRRDPVPRDEVYRMGTVRGETR